jgi:16S rRNA (uracil1498-N3)-methyltransferase
MRRFFLPASQIRDSQAVISGSEFHHLRHVLRLQAGEDILLCDEHGTEYQGTIVLFSSTSAEVRITHLTPTPSRFSLTLVQGLLKGQKMDLVIEKATELGVHQIIPLVSQFTVAQLRVNRQSDRLSRWQRIAQSAAKQSGTRVPHVTAPQSLGEVLQASQNSSEKILFYEKTRGETLKHFVETHPTLSTLSILIGAEGGFAEEEVEQARQAGCHVLSLGPHVLRAETASIVAISLCQFLWGTPNLPPLPER